MLSEATPGTAVRIPLMQADVFTYKYGPFYPSATYSCPVLVWAARKRTYHGAMKLSTLASKDPIATSSALARAYWYPKPVLSPLYCPCKPAHRCLSACQHISIAPAAAPSTYDNACIMSACAAGKKYGFLAVWCLAGLGIFCFALRARLGGTCRLRLASTL